MLKETHVPGTSDSSDSVPELTEIYNQTFYDAQIAGSLRSAKSILSYVFEIYKPNSVLDLGCGIGAWLLAASDLGATQLTGMDGEWVDPEKLLTKEIEFYPVNFESDIQITNRYDLVISVEVAEHVSERRADAFVSSLCLASDVVLFGAAICGQGGENHINEQWQSYWADKFEAKGYLCLDLIRPEMWNDVSIEWWYRQNTFLFVKKGSDSIDARTAQVSCRSMTDLVHPENYMAKSRLSDRFATIKMREKLQEQKEDADLYRVLANYFEKIDLEVAHRLMLEAVKHRPDGPYINKRLTELRSLLSK